MRTVSKHIEILFVLMFWVCLAIYPDNNNNNKTSQNAEKDTEPEWEELSITSYACYNWPYFGLFVDQ